MNQNFDIFNFSSVLVKCVKYEPNKHTMKFQLSWNKHLRDIRNEKLSAKTACDVNVGKKYFYPNLI